MKSEKYKLHHNMYFIIFHCSLFIYLLSAKLLQKNETTK